MMMSTTMMMKMMIEENDHQSNDYENEAARDLNE
jgi:hypothetical protein